MTSFSLRHIQHIFINGYNIWYLIYVYEKTQTTTYKLLMQWATAVSNYRYVYKSNSVLTPHTQVQAVIR